MNLRNLAIYGVIIVVLIALYSVLNPNAHNGGAGAVGEITYSQLLQKVDSDQVKDVLIRGEQVQVHDTGNHRFVATTPGTQDDLLKRLEAHGANIQVQSAQASGWMSLLFNLLPILLLAGVWMFFLRQMQGGARGAMGFGKSKAKLLTENKNKVTFEDVAGVDEAKEELNEIVDFLKEPGKFQRLGGKIPKGALLVGPPGTGKTLLARAIAGEAGVPFFSISGSDFVEMFVGVGASRVRDMFEQAKKNAPCIIFIDEIDAVGRHRGAGLGGGNDEREQTLNQLLVEMDGFEANEGIIVVAARPTGLTCWTPRCCGRVVSTARSWCPIRTSLGERRSCACTCATFPSPSDVDVQVVARGCTGLLRRRPGQPRERGGLDGGAQEPPHGHPARLRRRQGQGHDGRRAQVHGHERGREAHDRLPRGRPRPGGAERALGRSRAQGDDHPARPARWAWSCSCRSGTSCSMSFEQMTSRLTILLGGRVAEETDLGQGQGHLRRLVRHQPRPPSWRGTMVTRWGYSDELGVVDYGDNQEEVFLGHPSLGRRTSPKTPPRPSTPKCGAWSRPATTRRGGSSPSGSRICTP